MVPQRTTPGNGAPGLSDGVAVAVGRTRALAAPGVADALSRLLAHDVADWDRFGLERCKERTVRSVFRGRLGDAAVHVKVFRADTLADRARDALRTGRGEREARNLAAASGLGLPVAEVLATGAAVDRGQQRSFVVTRTIEDASPFTFAAPEAVHRRVGALLREVHDRGLDPGDLHPGNVLVDSAGRPWLIDLTSVRRGDAPTLVRRAAALALFCQDLDGGPLDPQARVLMAGYRAAGVLPPALDTELRLAARRWRARALVSFGRRATRACRHTEVAPRRRGEARWFWHRSGTPGDDAQRAECRAFVAEPPEPLRTGRRGAVWLTPGLAVKQRERGAARKLWRAAYWLLFARVAAPDPVALCLETHRGLVFQRRVDGPGLGEAIASGAIPPLAAARSLGRSVGRLHAHDLRNRDLKFENLVVDAGGEVRMVDLDGVRRCRADDARGIGADLGRLLAAFRAAGSPGGDATVRAFVIAWLRAHARLLRQPPWRRIRRHAERRAREWATAHG